MRWFFPLAVSLLVLVTLSILTSKPCPTVSRSSRTISLNRDYLSTAMLLGSKAQEEFTLEDQTCQLMKLRPLVLAIRGKAPTLIGKIPVRAQTQMGMKSASLDVESDLFSIQILIEENTTIHIEVTIKATPSLPPVLFPLAHKCSKAVAERTADKIQQWVLQTIGDQDGISL